MLLLGGNRSIGIQHFLPSTNEKSGSPARIDTVDFCFVLRTLCSYCIDQELNGTGGTICFFGERRTTDAENYREITSVAVDKVSCAILNYTVVRYQFKIIRRV
ncbi:hypothetical protein R1flu_003405 [Riccia fluitans]|uniref:Uncharacterized protein n=1 Tax=Riccia fluitans TaxID=41844 RepID=A0ABD1Y918_9MARC